MARVIDDIFFFRLTTIRFPVLNGHGSSGEEVRKLIQKEPTKSTAAAKAGMDEKTARKYLRMGKLPSEMTTEHVWRTRLSHV